MRVRLACRRPVEADHGAEIAHCERTRHGPSPEPDRPPKRGSLAVSTHAPAKWSGATAARQGDRLTIQRADAAGKRLRSGNLRIGR